MIQKSPKKPAIGIDFIFFDGEEGEPGIGHDYRDWSPLGSVHFSERLKDFYPESLPESALVIDMVCDKNLKIYQEKTSVRDAPAQVKSFWNIARRIDKSAFPDRTKYEIYDDHTPLNKAGIPSALIIDINYKPFHTTHDTLDKCSAKSLETVAQALFDYIYAVK
jgi:hypothetical protein